MILVAVNMSTKQEIFTRLDLARFCPSHAQDLKTKIKIPIIDGIIIFDLPPLEFRVIKVDIKSLGKNRSLFNYFSLLFFSFLVFQYPVAAFLFLFL